MKALPRKIYLYVEGQGEEEYLATAKDLKDITVEQGKRLRVGEYSLQRQVEVVTETTIAAEVG